MKVLKRSQLSELKKEMPMLDREELLSIIGGGTRYLMNTSGVWYSSTECEGPDQILVDGAKSGFTLDSGTTFYSGSNIGSGNRSGIVFEGATGELFEYLADNTQVEWGMSYNGSGKSREGVVSSNYDEYQVDFMPMSGYDWYIHNHPHGTKMCDDADFNTQYNYANKNGRYSKNYNYRAFELYGRDEDGSWTEFLDNLERTYDSSRY